MLRDRGLQFFHVNEEFPVSASHQLALITSLPFVHTARRYYRLNDRSEVFGLDARYSAPSGAGSSRDREDDRTRPFRGSKSRNKVSVGEPAEGSLETGPRYRQRLPVSRAPHPTPWPRALATTSWSPTARAPRPPTERRPKDGYRRKTVRRRRSRHRRSFVKKIKKKHPTPNGGSLGSWIDEDRSYLRVVV